jgi:UDP-N-acetylglucosamine transferase subunit ALG13
MRILVTVGMSRFPFDRLLSAVAPLCAGHAVFAQTGASRVSVPCESVPFLSFDELLDWMTRADVVICHAGNVVRVIQRQGKVPIAVARTASLGEAANDHQVEFLRQEGAAGPVIPAWDLADLADLIAAHAKAEARLLQERPLPPPSDGAAVARLLDEVCDDVAENRSRPPWWRRSACAWGELSRFRGNGLGCGSGDLVEIADTKEAQ